MHAKKYCYISPEFPQTAYLPYLSISFSEHKIAILPLNFIFVTLSEISEDIQIAQQELEQENLTVDQQCTLLPLQLDELYPLQKSYWKKKSYPFRPENRHELLIESLTNYSFCKLLITPWSVKKRPHLFSPSIPLYNNTHKNISLFLELSDFPVDTAARTVGIYRCISPIKYNWQNGETNDHPLLEQDITN